MLCCNTVKVATNDLFESYTNVFVYVVSLCAAPKSSESGNVLDTMLGPRSDNYKQILDMEERPYHFYQ